MSIEPKCAMNTDKEIWRRVPGDYYSPSMHVTRGGGIGINYGGHVIVAPVEKWHECGEKLLCVNERIPSWKWRLAMWLLRSPKEEYMAITEAELIERLKAKIDRQESALRLIRAMANDALAFGDPRFNKIYWICEKALEEKV